MSIYMLDRLELCFATVIGCTYLTYIATHGCQKTGEKESEKRAKEISENELL